MAIDKLWLDDETLASIGNGSKTYAQFLDTADKVQKGICPFCPEFFDCEKNTVLDICGDSEYEWRAWRNPYPLRHTQHHFILAPVRHITHLRSMTAIDWQNHTALVVVITNDFDGGCVATRYGNPHLNAGSIRHLHTNIIVPDGTGDVQVTIAKNPVKQQEVRRRISIFQSLRRHGVPHTNAKTLAQVILNEEDFEFVAERL